MLKHIDYKVDDTLTLTYTNNTEDVVRQYIIKQHVHHNTIDNICPIENVNTFKNNDYSAYWLIKYNNVIIRNDKCYL